MRQVTPSKAVLDKVDQAKVQLIIRYPFFGAAVSRRELCFTDDPKVPVACVTADGCVFLNPSFIENGIPKTDTTPAVPKPTTANLVFLLAHEAMHYMLGHVARRGHRDPAAFNVACDKVINDMLVDARVGEFIAGGVSQAGARHHAAEELYIPPAKDDSRAMGGIGRDMSEETKDGKPLDASQQAAHAARAKVELIQAAKAARQVGKLPAAIEKLVERITKSPIPWHETLARFMQGRVKDDYSWTRPNRRFVSQGMYLPGCDYIPRMGEIALVVDVSGSIRQEELDAFAGHMNRIIDDCRPERVHVVYCDTHVRKHEAVEPEDYPVTLTAVGGGGTDMPEAFAWLLKEGIRPEVTVVLTDGYTPFGNEPPMEVVWLMTTPDRVAPYGLTLTTNN